MQFQEQESDWHILPDSGGGWCLEEDRFLLLVEEGLWKFSFEWWIFSLDFSVALLDWGVASSVVVVAVGVAMVAL